MAGGDFGEAKLWTEIAVQLQPDFAEAWVCKGMAAMGLGDLVMAKESYEQALALHVARHNADPTNANEATQQVFALHLLARHDEAQDLQREMLVKHPEDKTLKSMGDFVKGGSKFILLA